jgi:hypothetical protein
MIVDQVCLLYTYTVRAKKNPRGGSPWKMVRISWAKRWRANCRVRTVRARGD